MKIRILLALVVVLGLTTAAHAQAACGQGSNPACDPSSIVNWTAPTTNADTTPLTDLAGYDVLICTTSPCTRTTAGVVIRDVGKPATACTNGLGVTVPAPCVFVGPLQIPTAGTKFLAIDAYDTAPVRNTSAVSGTGGPFVYSLTAPDRLAPSAPGIPTVQ